MRVEFLPSFKQSGGVVGIVLIPQTDAEETNLAEVYKAQSHVHLCCKAFVKEKTSPNGRSRRKRLWLMQSCQIWKPKK